MGEGGKHKAYGGLLRDRPIPRAPLGTGWAMQDMRTEVSNAKAAGLDGFMVNTMGTSGGNWTRILNLTRAAKELGGFTITPMVDANGAIGSQTPAVIAAKLAEIYAIGAGWTVDGGLALSTFKADGKTVAWWTEVINLLEAKVGPVRFIAAFLSISDARLKEFAPISYGFGVWGNRHLRTVTAAPNYAAKAHALGKKWMQPVAYQDARPHSYVYAESNGTATGRLMWERAINDGADFVQAITWNDYSESTQISPSVDNDGTFSELTAYYAKWFRDGQQPRVSTDRVYLLNRIHPHAAGPAMKPTLDGVSIPVDITEALCFLTAPAQVSLNDAPPVDVPAGITPVKVPLRLGAQRVRVTRAGRTVLDFTSHDSVTDKPPTADLAYHAVAMAGV
jgi:hypothetical protein